MEYCTICMKKVVDEKNTLCKTCNKKRQTSKIVVELSEKLNLKEKLSEKNLISIGISNKIRRNHYLWSLEECNLIKKEKNYFIWENEKEVLRFVEKYGDSSAKEIKENIEHKKSETITCQRCGTEILNSKKKTKYCKNCKKINKTLKNISKLEKIVQENTPFTIEEIINKTGKEEWQIEGIIWDLQDNDLINQNDSEEFILDFEKINQFKENNSIETTDNDTTKKDSPIMDKNTIEDKNITSQTDTTKDNIKTPNIIDKTEDTKENDKENKINEISTDNIENRIIEYLEKYISILPRSVKLNDVSNNDIYINFSDFLLEKYNEKVEKQMFTDYFPSLLFRTYPNAYRSFFNNATHFNIEINYKKDKTADETIDNTEKEHTSSLTLIEDDLITSRIEEYITKNLIILDREPNSTDPTHNDILNNFKKFTKEKYNEIIDDTIFSRKFRLIKNKYKINQKIYYKKIRYNIKIKNNTKEEIYSVTFIQDEILIISRIEEYITKNLIILDREPNSTDPTHNDILNNFKKFTTEKYNEIIDDTIFTRKFRKIQKEYKIKNKFVGEKNRYNVGFNFENNKIQIEDNLSTDIINQFIENKIIMLNRKPNSSDITISNIYETFNTYLVNNNENEMNFTDFFKLFRQIKNKFNIKQSYINGYNRYNIEIKDDIDKKSDFKTIDTIYQFTDNNIVSQRITEYIVENLFVLDREPKYDDPTINDLYYSFLIFLKCNKYQEIDFIHFGNTFRKLQKKYNISQKVLQRKNRYNVKILDNKDQNNEKTYIQHSLQKTIKNKNVQKINKNNTIPQNTIHNAPIITESFDTFTANYDENTLIFVKSRITFEKYESLIILMDNTKKYINSLNIKKIDNTYEIFIEFMIPKNEKEKVVNIINRYRW